MWRIFSGSIHSNNRELCIILHTIWLSLCRVRLFIFFLFFFPLLALILSIAIKANNSLFTESNRIVCAWDVLFSSFFLNGQNIITIYDNKIVYDDNFLLIYQMLFEKNAKPLRCLHSVSVGGEKIWIPVLSFPRKNEENLRNVIYSSEMSFSWELFIKNCLLKNKQKYVLFMLLSHPHLLFGEY